MLTICVLNFGEEYAKWYAKYYLPFAPQNRFMNREEFSMFL